MGSSRIAALASAAIVALTIFTVILPELNRGIVLGEVGVVEKVLEHFVQPELFATNLIDLSGEWLYTVKSYDEGVLEELFRPDAPVADWRTVTVPFTHAATVANSTVWLRRDFSLPEGLGGNRVRLIFLGAFYRAAVWLNGIYLGEHEGYFSPFYFDVTDLLNFGGSNTLVVCLSSPVELDLDNKRAFIGIFGDGNVKPYPRWALGKLPRNYEWFVPIGLWKPVVLAVSGPVAVNVVLIDAVPEDSSARVRVRLYVSNVGERAQCVLRYSISPYNFEGEGVDGQLTFEIGKDDRRWIEFEITLRNPRLWWTWDQGFPHLYSFRYEIRSRDGVLMGSSSVRFGIRSLRGSEIVKGRATFVLNSRRVFLRGFNYIHDFFLVNVSTDTLYRDLRSIVDAHANFVRVYAHVGPTEFYSLADEMGLAVQADSPLIWAYASRLSGAEYGRFVESAHRQIAKMVLLLYNHPSVVIWTVHNEPPWACEWMGDLYRRGVNRDLDTALAALISSLDGHSRPIITGGGYEDQHVYHGWFSGSWTDFLYDASTFPTEFGAQSLPSITSPFWRIVNISKWPIEEGSPEFYDLVYRGLYAPRAFQLPFGQPRDYPSLVDYIEASQRYQANLLRIAIARYRVLKFNVTAGAAVFLFRDCFPQASFSVVDYFGIPKLAYYTVAEMFKPLKVIVAIGGEFESRGVQVVYKANSTFKADVWVVNDLANETGSAMVRWRMSDAVSGQLIAEGAVNVTLPAAWEPARLVQSLRMEAPASTEGLRWIRFEAELLRGGRLIDKDEIYFAVEPLSRVVVNLEGVEGRLTFYVASDRFNFYVTSEGGKLSFAVPAGSKVTIIGPRFDGATPYTPVRVDLPSLNPGTTSLTVRLVEGAIYTVRLPLLTPQVARTPTLRLRVEAGVRPESPIITVYDDPELRVLLNLRGNDFIVPAGVPVTLSLEVDGAIVVRREVELAPNERLVEGAFASSLAQQSLARGEREMRQAKSMLASLERQGFYLGLSKQLLDRASRLLEAAADLIEAYPERAAASIAEASLLLKGVMSRLNELKSAAQLNLPLLLLMIILVSFGLSSLIVENESARPAAGTLLLVGLGVLMYFTYPGFSGLGSMELFIALYVSFFVLVLMLLLPYLLEGLRSEKGVPLLAAATSALSIAARNLRRRRLRTCLTLLSVAAFALAVTNLTSVNYFVSLRELVTTVPHPQDAPNVLAAFSGGELSLADIMYLSSQPEVLRYGFKVESRARAEPYAVISGRLIRGFIGFYGYTPISLPLVTPPSRTGHQDFLTVAFVSSTFEGLGVKPGDVVQVGEVKLKIIGFFDPAELGRIRDVGGYDLLPRVLQPDGSVGVAHPDEVIIVPALTALRLGGFISRLYAEASSPDDLRALAERLALQSDYVVVALPAGDYQRVYFTGPTIEYRGSEAILPVALVFINVASVVLASVYERRGEIVTMASVGMNPTHILLVFLSEALLLGFVGGSLGYIVGVSTFRVVQWTGVALPVDVKTSVWDMMGVVTLSITSSLAAALVPSLKASQYVTPSLRRRWKLEAQVVGGEWYVEIPIRVSAERVAQFVDYLAERLREEERGIERSTARVGASTSIVDGRTLYEVSFTYSRGGGRPFTASVIAVVKPVGPEFYSVAVKVKPLSIYSRFYQSYVQEVVAFVRGIVLEWASLKIRLLAPVGVDVSKVVELVRNYQPQLVLLATRRGDGRLVRELRSRLRAQGLRPPATEVIAVKSDSLDGLVEELRLLISKADIVALDSDDGLLSAALALAAAIEGRRVAVIREGRLEEVSVDRLLKLQ
ncbi:MAG: FtsX-like permease family protein [Thermofilaceae archaeon]